MPIPQRSHSVCSVIKTMSSRRCPQNMSPSASGVLIPRSEQISPVSHGYGFHCRRTEVVLVRGAGGRRERRYAFWIASMYLETVLSLTCVSSAIFLYSMSDPVASAAEIHPCVEGSAKV